VIIPQQGVMPKWEPVTREGMDAAVEEETPEVDKVLEVAERLFAAVD
jgi:hypothetical protein